jgi:hypothetical protein
MQSFDKILILTPVKDAAAYLPAYFLALARLTYPRDRLSIAFLESDSRDDTFASLEAELAGLRQEFRRATLWKKDFGFQIPPGTPRYAPHLQVARRAVLARSRNHLLFRALDDEDWVLWLDVDVIEYPPTIIEAMLRTGKQIVHPHCVYDYGGPSFDLNAWRDQGRLHMHDLRNAGELVELDAVGGTMLLVRADVHRDGLIFPPFPYGLPNPRIRTHNQWMGEIETEGLGIMASDMGVPCWGMPGLEIRHRQEGPPAQLLMQREQAIIAQRLFRYVRVGYDERPLELLPDHTIGLGSARCEQRWRLGDNHGIAVLALIGEEGVMCLLQEDDAGVWKGHWLAYEGMPVELQPLM